MASQRVYVYATGLEAAKTEPFSRSQKLDSAAKFVGAQSAESIQKEKKTIMICHNVKHANSPIIGNVWPTWMPARIHTARQAAENTEDWHFPACTHLTQVQKDTKNLDAKGRELVKVLLQPTWEAAALLLANPDFKTYVPR